VPHRRTGPGQSVPIKFSLGGDQGLDVIAAGNGWYSHGWNTRKEWAGTCRALVTQVNATEHLAYFQFK
jgi:hypothetical protein